MTTSIMEDFGYIASRLAEIEREKQEQRETEAATITEPAKEPAEDIWGSVYGFTPDIYCAFFDPHLTYNPKLKAMIYDPHPGRTFKI